MKTHYCFLAKSQEIMNSLYQIDFASPKIGDKSPIPEIIEIFDKESDLASFWPPPKSPLPVIIRIFDKEGELAP